MFQKRVAKPLCSVGLAIGCLIVLSTYAVSPVLAQAEELPSLEHALLDNAAQILKFAREQGYQNVGVLKFRIREGNGQPSDRAGVLNLNLADRLELALIIKNKLREPVGIVHNASAVAASIPGANHLAAEGRAKLFSANYPLAWGKESVVPDAFFVGVVQVEDDFQTAVIGISAFDRKSDKLQSVARFKARMTTNDLAEIGTSFTTRGIFDNGQVNLSNEDRNKQANKEAAQVALAIKTKQARQPLDDPASPVVLTIQYDGQPVTVEFRDGGAFVPEPNEGQKVSLVVGRRNPEDKTRYAVVLKVNGENTLYRQRKKDFDCNKWVLEPGDQPLTIDGFQITDTEKQKFTVLSKAASKSREMDYGADVGTISMTVFQPRSAATPPPPPSNLLAEDAEDFAILSRGNFPKGTPESLAALKSQLVASTQTRGLITEGKTEAGATRTVKFDPDPVPVIVASVTYYKP
jgi:hypothetical protein